jgi:DNA-binding CsgD family transcriptional regulator/tetratricopeptide (TPR) repeat protein
MVTFVAQSPRWSQVDGSRTLILQFGTQMMDALRHETHDRWRELLAVGLVADDMSADTIARCAGVSRLEVLEAFAAARAFGVMDDDDSLVPEEATRLIADLGIDKESSVHAEMVRHSLSLGRGGLDRAVHHAQRVTSAPDTEAVIALCDHSAEVNLSLGDYRSARRLFETAAALDIGAHDHRQAMRLLHLAAAVDGEGDVLEARKLLERVSVHGERLGDVDLVVEAAVRHTLPTEWYAGDHRSLALLQRAENFVLSPDHEVRVAAARGLAEMRIPVRPHEGQQLAWITRPEAAQPLTEWALERAQGLAPETRALAMLAWRSTHRNPRYLTERLEITRELLTLSQELRRPALQVDAAVYLAADAVESGDRQLYDKALAVTRWVADRDGSARLSWRADTLAAGAAHLDGDVDMAIEAARRAQHTGEAIGAPGWFAAMMFFEVQAAVSRDDVEAMRNLLFDESVPGMNNPLSLAGIGHCFARCGDVQTARRYARKALRQLDFEASPLLLLSRLAATALLVDDTDLRRELLEIMAPWVDHVAVDSNAWWCDGPISLWMALLHESLGESERARDLMERSRDAVNLLHDVRSRRRIGWLAQRLTAADEQVAPPLMTERELMVLRLLADGATNAAIAQALNYSVSTVRNDTVSVYRKLGVSGRPEAVARAMASGLLGVDVGSVEPST